jgi:hypothetical protein
VSVGRSSHLDRVLVRHIRVNRCDVCVCDLGVVGVPSIFGLTRSTGAFVGELLTFVLVSGFQIVQHNVALTRVSALCVGLGVGGATIASGSCVRPSNSWDSQKSTVVW